MTQESLANPYSPHGQHVLADLYGVESALLSDEIRIENLLIRAAESAQAHLIWSRFHHFGDAMGVTGVLLLAESHISIHTWPEHGFAAADIFMCGQASPDQALEVIKLGFSPLHYQVHSIIRGIDRK